MHPDTAIRKRGKECFSTGKAILTAVIGWLALAIPMALLGAASR